MVSLSSAPWCGMNEDRDFACCLLGLAGSLGREKEHANCRGVSSTSHVQLHNPHTPYVLHLMTVMHSSSRASLSLASVLLSYTSPPSCGPAAHCFQGLV